MQLDYALNQIADIRRQMNLARLFRGFRTASTLATGMAAVGAGIWQARHIPDAGSDPLYFVTLWASVAAASVIVCGGEVAWRYHRTDSPSQRELAIAAAEQFLPFILVGGMLTIAITQYAAGVMWMLPGLWQMLFGFGILSLRRMSPLPIYFVGTFYILSGLLNISGGMPHLSAWAMAAPFGVGQTACAVIFYLYLEREHAE